MKRISLFSLLALGLFLFKAHANREEPVSSPNGGQPYKIVYKDSSTDSTREPGLYTRNGTDWAALFPGEILIDPKRGPIIQILHIARADDRIPALAVMDGRIRLFTVLSDAGVEKTHHTVHQVVDLGTGQEQELPLIKSSEDLTIHQVNANPPVQLILASLKTDAGAGLTIALRVRTSDGPDLEVLGPAYILDHRFRSAAELQLLARPSRSGGTQVFSELLQIGFANRLRLGDFGEYQTAINAFLHRQVECLKNNKDMCNVEKLASWSVETGKASFVDELRLKKPTGPYQFELRWPLSFGVPESHISMGDASSMLPGRLRVNPAGDIWTVNNDSQGSRVVLFGLENSLYAATSVTQQRFWLTKLGPLHNGRLPDKMSLASRVRTVDGKGILYLVASTLYRDRDREIGNTALYVLPITGDKQGLIVERVMNINANFYEVDELTSRLIQDEDSKRIAFDTLTPAQGDKQKYDQARQKSSPYLDLEQSNSSDAKYIFTNPTQVFKLAPRIEYRQFEGTALSNNPTGIHVEGDPTKVILGTLIPRPESPAKEGDPAKYEFLRQATPIPHDKLGPIAAKVWAVDPTHRNGENGFRLALSLHLLKDGKAQVILKDFVAFNIEYSDLLDIRLVNGRKDMADRLYAVLFTRGNGMFFIPLKIENGALQVEAVAQLNRGGDDTPISPDELISRLVHDKEKGDLHFVNTPGVSPNSREFQVFNFRTGELFYPKREHGGPPLNFDFETSLIGQYQTMSDESSMSWKVKPFASEKKTKNKANDLARSELFSHFRKILEEASDPAQAPRRRVILVPDEIKDLALDFVEQSYMVKSQIDAPEGSRFHRFNRGLSLYKFDHKKASADEVFENFEIIQSRKAERSVVVADLNDLVEIERSTSKNEKKPFVLKIPALGHDDENNPTVQEETLTPHILYLMAAGSPLSFEEFRQKTPPVLAETVLVGTKDEWDLLLEQAETEVTAGLDKAFEVIPLPEPTLDSKTDMLEQVMIRPDVKGLKFTFDAAEIVDGTLTPDEQRRKIFEYAVTRIDALARPRGENTFTAFIEFLSEFNMSLVTDPIARSTRRIDRSFVERILKNQFNLSLNLADLPADEPRRILSRDDAVFLMQRAGMLGEFELKAEVIRLTLAQLNHDPARNMPSTWIWAGEPGTGKSKAWEALAKALNLKRWNRTDSEEKRAQANEFFLDTVRVKKGDQAAIDQVITDLNAFISSPKGSSGFIFFDDFSFADDALGKALVQWIRGLQQAEKGIARVPRVDGSTVSVSVQNLVIGIAMNFSDNKSQLAQFQGDDVSTLVGKIVATGSRFGMDKSFVDRFGGVYNFDRFHESVKEPTLNQGLLEAAQKKMARTGQYVVVDPMLVRQAASAFPKLGARGFLSKTTEAIISQPDQVQLGKAKVFAIIPKTAEELAENEKNEKPRSTGAWGEESAEVKHWVTKHARVIELEHGLAAPLMLMRLMVPSFRSPILESLVYSIQMDPRLKNDQMARGFFQVPALFAAFDHLLAAETIPLKDLKIDDSQFEMRSDADKEELKLIIEELSIGASPFVIPFPTSGGRLSLWPELGVGGERVIHSDSRKDVLIRYSQKIEAAIQRHLLRTLHVRDLSEIHDVESWLKNLPEHVPNTNDDLGRELTDLLFAFMKDFQSPDLFEAANGGTQLEPYASTRFFLMALDQAVAKLPWAELAQQMTKALRLISQDMVLGQSVGVQNWLFNSADRTSLLKPTTTNLIREMVEFNSLVRETPAEERKAYSSRFSGRCESYLVGKRGK